MKSHDTRSTTGKRLGTLLASSLLFLIGPPGFALEKSWIHEHEGHLDTLFAALEDTPVAPLQSAYNAWYADQQEQACLSLITYYRQRPSALEGLTPSLNLPAEGRFHADAWLNGITSPLGFDAPLLRLPNGSIDWYQRGPKNDKEFAWMLNRHLILPLLRNAYEDPEATTAPAYLEAIDTLILDWVTNNPYPNRITFSPPWRPLEVARRILDSWAPSFDFLRAKISDEALLLFLASIPNHADALAEHASSWGGNHLLTEKIALAVLAMQWPEFGTSERWLQHALEIITEQFLKQTYPDGAYIELANHYQKIVLQNIQHLIEIPELKQKNPPQELLERIEIAWDFYAKTSKPDGSGPLNNDSDYEQGRPLILDAAHFFEREDWRYIASSGQNGKRPITISPALFPWAGVAIFRDSFEATSHWAYFNYGPYGTAHQHNDKLHLSIALQGQDFLVDQGRNSYFPDKWRTYFTGPAGHNMVEFEGLAPRARPHKRRSPQDALIYTDENWSVVASELWYDSHPRGEKPSWLHRRFVIHQRLHGFFVIDRLIGFGASEGTVRWHFDPSLDKETIVSSFLKHPASTTESTPSWFRGSHDPVAGWHSKQYNQKEAAWQLDHRFRISQPETFIWSVGAHLDATIETHGDVVTLSTATGSLHLQLKTSLVDWQPAQ